MAHKVCNRFLLFYYKAIKCQDMQKLHTAHLTILHGFVFKMLQTSIGVGIMYKLL